MKAGSRCLSSLSLAAVSCVTSFYRSTLSAKKDHWEEFPFIKPDLGKATQRNFVASLENLNFEITRIFREDDSILRLIRSRLFQYQMGSVYSDIDILSEAYLRTASAIRQGREVTNVQGWLRSTSLNIIAELSRQDKKQKSLEDKVKHFTFIEPDLYRENFSVDEQVLKDLSLALKTLSPEDSEIISLRFIQQLSWQDISKLYEKRGDLVSVTAIRKRGQRALERLRQSFHKLSSQINIQDELRG